MGIATLESYGLDELEELQQQHPEFGRVEIINGSLIAGGVDVTGDRHQSVVQALFLLLIEQCPSEQVIRLDTYWFGDQVRLRPDVAIWPTPDRPADGGAFVTPPLAVIEVLSTDADHDLVRKYEIYRSFGVVSWFVDPAQRNGWWLSDGDAFRFDGEIAAVELPGRPPIEVPRSLLSA